MDRLSWNIMNNVHIYSDYFNAETGESIVTISTPEGLFTGRAQTSSNDKDIQSRFLGCDYAKGRAIIKYLKHLKSNKRAAIKELVRINNRLPRRNRNILEINNRILDLEEEIFNINNTINKIKEDIIQTDEDWTAAKRKFVKNLVKD